MARSHYNLTTKTMNMLFASSLGSNARIQSNIGDKPLLVDADIPFTIKMRVYLYRCTNPPGGRAADEYKCQIIVPDQKRG